VRILTPLRHGHHFPDGPVLDEPSNEDMHRHANLDMTNRSRSQYSLGNTDPASRHSLGFQRLGGHPKIIRRYMGVCMTRLRDPQSETGLRAGSNEFLKVDLSDQSKRVVRYVDLQPGIEHGYHVFCVPTACGGLSQFFHIPLLLNSWTDVERLIDC
jgi:hypothetical protein